MADLLWHMAAAQHWLANSDLVMKTGPEVGYGGRCLSAHPCSNANSNMEEINIWRPSEVATPPSYSSASCI